MIHLFKDIKIIKIILVFQISFKKTILGEMLFQHMNMDIGFNFDLDQDDQDENENEL